MIERLLLKLGPDEKEEIKAMTISCQNLLHTLVRTVAISYLSIVLQDLYSFLWPAFVHT